MAPDLCGFVCGFRPTETLYEGLRSLLKSYDNPRRGYGFRKNQGFCRVLPKLKVAGSRPVARVDVKYCSVTHLPP